VTLTTIAGGITGTVATLSFGSSTSGISLIGGDIDASAISNYAFSMPRDGTIAGVTAYFSTTAALNLSGTSVTIQAQIYTSAIPGNSFTPVAGTAVTLTPALTGGVGVGTMSSGSLTGLNIPLTTGTRVLVVFSATAAGDTLINTVSGYASGGLELE
jgi:BclB C-terminal domain-containing protein